MKRALLLSLAVLLPFIALVALGLRALEGPAPVQLPPPAPAPAVAEPAPLAPPTPAIAPVPPTPVTAVPLPLPTPPAPPPPPAEPKRELLTAEEPDEDAVAAGVAKEAIAAVEPLVAQCFTDSAEGKRKRSPPKATVSFALLDSGRFARVRVQRQSWPDPQLTACLEDAFADARFEPAPVPLLGDTARRFVHTFRTGGSDAGRR